MMEPFLRKGQVGSWWWSKWDTKHCCHKCLY